MTFGEYQEAAHKFAVYGGNTLYPVLGLSEEAGEVSGKVAKFIRKHEGITPTQAKEWVTLDEEYRVARLEIAKELGDVLWMVAEVAKTMDLNLDEIAEANLAKLTDRKSRGVIVGEGDNR